MTAERIKALLHMFNEAAPIARLFGMRLSFTEEANAAIDLPYNPLLDHGSGGVHGGVCATMLDSAGWFTAAASHDAPSWHATSQLNTHFLEPARETSLRAIGRLLKRGRRQVVAEMCLYDDQDRLVGHATGTFAAIERIPLH